MTVDQMARILNVDDYDVKRYAKTRALRQAGFHVTETSSGEDALRRVLADPPDLVILDVRLPDISGLEVARRIRAEARTASVMILQTSATFLSATDRTMGLEAGADAYMLEPVEAQELVAQVNALLRLRRAEQALRHAAAEWQATFDAIADAVAVLDTDGRIRRANTAFRRLVAARAPALEGRPAADVLPEAAGMVGDVVRSGALRSVELTLGAAYHEATISPVCADDRTVALILVVRDVSERRRAEEERKAQLADEQTARAIAEAESRAKDELLAATSHELRAPLNSILGWVVVLRDPRVDAATRARAVDQIQRSARAQSRLVNDLLDFSRIVTGKLSMTRNPVDLRVVVEETVESMQPTADSRGVTLSATIGVRDGWIAGDEDRLRQVIWNLIANGIKFTRSGGRVDVMLAAVEKGIVLTVADTGRGIDPTLLPHVFDAFRQGEGLPAREQRGLGLGLSIVRHVVQMHGGTVTAESDGPGRGARFTVVLPTVSEP